jgi:ribonuclease Z
MFSTELKSKADEDISILIKLDNYPASFICECGDASGLTVKDCQNTAAIFISHTHIDHFINFDFILRHQIGIGKKVIICGPEGITQQVQSKIKGYQWNLIEAGAITYEIREIIEEDHIIISELDPPKWDIKILEVQQTRPLFSNEKMEVEFTILDHKTPSIAYLFKEKDSINIDIQKSPFKGGSWIRELKKAFEACDQSCRITIEGKDYEAGGLFHLLDIRKGDSVGIIMDHAASVANHSKIKALFQGCNKVFIECFYRTEDKEYAQLNYHSYSEASAKIMKACQVDTAIPVHFSRKYNIEDINELQNEFHANL